MIDLTIDLVNKSFLVKETKDDKWHSVQIYRKVGDSELKKFGYKISFTQLPTKESLVSDYEESLYSKFNDDPFLIGTHKFYDALPNSSVLCNIVAFNKRESFDYSFEIKVPILKQPYPSWTWDEGTKCWIPPIPMPEPLWDEDSKSWYLP